MLRRPQLIAGLSEKPRGFVSQTKSALLGLSKEKNAVCVLICQSTNL